MSESFENESREWLQKLSMDVFNKFYDYCGDTLPKEKSCKEKSGTSGSYCSVPAPPFCGVKKGFHLDIWYDSYTTQSTNKKRLWYGLRVGKGHWQNFKEKVGDCVYPKIIDNEDIYNEKKQAYLKDEYINKDFLFNFLLLENYKCNENYFGRYLNEINPHKKNPKFTC